MSGRKIPSTKIFNQILSVNVNVKFSKFDKLKLTEFINIKISKKNFCIIFKGI